MALPLLLLSVYYRYYRTAGPSSTGYPNIRTSAGYPFYCQTAPLRRSTSLWWWIPGVDLWDGIPAAAAVISSRSRVTAALGRPKKFPRKVRGRSQESADDPGLSRWPSGPAGEITKILKMSFWRIIKLLMISASILKL